MMMKRLMNVLLVLLCLFVIGGTVFAAEAELIWVEDGIWYDKSMQMFVYRGDSEGTEFVRSSVADGMITTKTVSVTADAEAKLAIYRDGEVLDADLYRQLGEPGDYVVMYHDGELEKRILAFTVIPAATNSITGYHMPKGFELVRVTVNNEPLACEDDYVCFEKEGDYRVLYRCLRTGMNYSLKFTADFTGPQLRLEAVDNGKAYGPVDITDAEDTYFVEIFKDGESIEYVDRLTESGKYRICLTDTSGNTSVYQFTILIYFTAIEWFFIALVLLAIVGAVAFAMFMRKHLKVR